MFRSPASPSHGKGRAGAPVSMGTLAGASVLPISSISSLKSKPSKCAGTGLSWRLSHEGPQGSTERPSQKTNRKGKSPEFGGSTVGAISG